MRLRTCILYFLTCIGVFFIGMLFTLSWLMSNEEVAANTKAAWGWLVR